MLYLLFSPLLLHTNGKFTPSSIILFPPFPLHYPPPLSFLFPSPHSFPPLHASHFAPHHSFWVTAVHSPVPYCGAVHHLHAFSILQQNEFLIGPEGGERNGKRRWLSFKPVLVWMVGWPHINHTSLSHLLVCCQTKTDFLSRLDKLFFRYLFPKSVFFCSVCHIFYIYILSTNHTLFSTCDFCCHFCVLWMLGNEFVIHCQFMKNSHNLFLCFLFIGRSFI